MANEIKATVILNVTKGGVSMLQNLSVTEDMAGDEMINNVQIVGTSQEAINIGDITTPSYIICKNLDPTNFIQIGADPLAAEYLTKLLPGQITLFPANQAVVYAKASVECKMLVLAIEA